MHWFSRDFLTRRQNAKANLPEFDLLCDEAAKIRDHSLAHLDHYLERFEERVTALGGHVHWAPTAADANRAVEQICKSVGATTVVKGKSMVSEEIGLNHHLESVGLRPIETDVGEYVLQLADEPPFHIVGPALHKTKEQISALFHQHLAAEGEAPLVDPADMVKKARETIRPDFLDAVVGITGANFLVAETGTAVVVSNEGNCDLSMTLPKTHIVVTGIEKVVPTLEDASTLLRVLARSVSGQDLTIYTSFVTGPKRLADLDGPENFHVVLYDGGRSNVLGSPAKQALRCIRCSACMNHCPVYHAAGGHSYGWVYPGPIGAALNPGLIGLESGYHLPRASSFCGRCNEVCPVRIPLTKIMHHWREQEFAGEMVPASERTGMRLWGFVARRPWLYRFATRWASRLLRLLAGRKRRLSALPGASGWTFGRDLPTPSGPTFFDQWNKEEKSA